MSQIELAKTIFFATLAFIGVLFAVFCIALTMYHSAITEVKPRQKTVSKIVLSVLMALLIVCTVNSFLAFLYLQNLFLSTPKVMLTLFYIEMLSPLLASLIFVLLSFRQ